MVPETSRNTASDSPQACYKAPFAEFHNLLFLGATGTILYDAFITISWKSEDLKMDLTFPLGVFVCHYHA